MAFQTPITIKKALDAIHRHDYVLPAIQREFVWNATQIARLFDSLMRGYPVGSFLFWKVERANTRRFKFYDFVRTYHQRDARHCPALDLSGDQEVVAVLDGQQRLTALNIGLRGSYAEKEPRKRWSNSEAFPIKRLYLNLLGDTADNEEGMRFDFRFLTEGQAAKSDPTQQWFPVARIMDMRNAGPDIHGYLVGVGLAASQDAFATLDKLYGLVHRDAVVNHYLEEEQDLDKVLNIFIRVNSGGTVLSYSDLLLSIATAEWTDLDAREAIHGLVDDLNKTRNGFAFSQDFVLKAGLMLSDIASVGFRVTNFNKTNMAELERNWERISRALRRTVQLVAGFGFDSQTLSADSALLPIAYYAYQRDLPESYLTSRDAAPDRERIRTWLIRSLLKAGVWGSGLDTTLTALRTVIKEDGASAFPVDAIEVALAKRGRSLRFEEDEVLDLAEIRYGDSRCFGLLALLFSSLDLRNTFHIDHVFPAARFTTAKLRKAGISDGGVEAMADGAQRLPNLQLLEGPRNQSKNDQLPAAWLRSEYANNEAARQHYVQTHSLHDLPEQLSDFLDFYEARKARLMTLIRDVLKVSPSV